LKSNFPFQRLFRLVELSCFRVSQNSQQSQVGEAFAIGPEFEEFFGRILEVIGLRVGLLLNFNSPTLVAKRVVT
jgi:hypothetical protein